MERKLATVLFVDLVGSTALVAASDPEIVRRRVTAFFDQVARCVTTHGGIVEKFAGDAVMAAFGVPRAHEDDAERAVRAAFATLEAVRGLGLEARVGVESGEVVVDDGDSTFATGEAVNLAARLQQAAAPGEILVGPGAFRLAAGRIELAEAGPLEVRGLPGPVRAWRAVCPVDVRPLRSLAVPLVGREDELDLLANTFSRARRDRRAHVVTIFGEPGVGKSRLAREFVEGIEGATVLQGRCLPYGEGVTYWPLAEMVKAAAGIADDDPSETAAEKLRACCEEEAVADLLALAAGVLEAVEGERAQEEIAWAAREWAEQLAADQPLVLVFEDIHWAEDPLLELIEHLAAWVREAPLLLLCLARPELLDHRPGWGGGRVRATAVELEALPPEDSERLADALLADRALPADVRRELLETTEGNPLFLEETIRMLEEDSGGRHAIPDTLQALIAARIDRLPAPERALLRRASVIGRVFWRGALEHLSDGADVDKLIEDLLWREFVLREQRSTISGERAFRFKHVLIREVAYAGLSKSARAELHARFGAWLGERAGDELLEIRSYHLDQAAALLGELDGAPPGDLAREAAAALEAAGRRALAREAHRSARKHFVRAIELEPTLPRRYLAARAASWLNDYPAVSVEMERVCAEAAAAGETRIQARALVTLAETVLYRDADVERARELADRALEVLGDEGGAARFDALGVQHSIAWWTGDLDEAERLSREAVEIARAAGRTDLESRAVGHHAGVHIERLELDRALPLLERARELAEASGSISRRAGVQKALGNVHLLRGDLDEAEAATALARDLFLEAGSTGMHARTLNSLAKIALQRGDAARAEKLLRDAVRLLAPLGDRSTLCETQRQLAETLVARGRLEEAEAVALEARKTVGPQDAGSRATTRMALAEVYAAQGRDGEAEALLREALDVLAPTGFRQTTLEPLQALVRFLHERGRDEEAAPFEQRLLELAPAVAIGGAFERVASRA